MRQPTKEYQLKVKGFGGAYGWEYVQIQADDYRIHPSGRVLEFYVVHSGQVSVIATYPTNDTLIFRITTLNANGSTPQ